MLQSDTEIFKCFFEESRWGGREREREREKGRGREGVMRAGSKKLHVLCNHEPQFCIKGKKKVTWKNMEDDSKDINHSHSFENGGLSTEY